MAADLTHRDVLLARLIAERLHDGQLRLDDEPYFGHVERVGEDVRALGPRAAVVGYLHDALEDTDLEPCALRSLFGDDVAADVEALTRGTEEPYADYIERVRAGSDVAVAVKLADLRDNLAGDPPPSLRRRYEPAMARLLAEQTARAGAGPPARVLSR